MENLAGIYLRVSTEDQHPENQIADVKRLAEALKYKVIEVYVDRESGQYSDRREFQRMMMDAEAGKFTTLFIWALDRFSREGIKATLTHIEKLKEIGVAIKSYQESWLDTANEGIWQLLVAVLSWAAKEELKRFRERSMAGKKRMLSEGRLVGSYPAFGWDYVKRDKEKSIDGYFKVNEKEAEVVKKIFQWYIELESIFLVTKRLKEREILTRGRNGNPRYFQTSTVAKILGRETYIGNHYYGKNSPCLAQYHINKVRKHKLTGRKGNPKSEWKMVKVPPIIELEVFNKSQEIRRKRVKLALQKSKYDFLCQGVIRCIDCGKLYGGRNQRDNRTGKDNLIYRCPQHYGSNFNQAICRSKSIMVNRLDNLVWTYVSGLILDKEKIKNNLHLLKEKREKGRISNRGTLNSLQLEKSNFQKKRSNILELYSDEKVSDNTKEILVIKLNEFDKKEKTLDSQIADISRELAGFDNLDTVEQEVEKICGLYKQQIANPSFDLKKYIVRKWIDEINILDDGSIKINVRIPIGEELKETEKNVEYIYSFPRGILEPQVSLKFEEVISSK